MTSFKEIVTKAIIGKCKKVTNATFDVECENSPDTILGCWVINHSFRGVNNHGKINISGSYDVYVWYSYDNDSKTAVCMRQFTYNDVMNVSLKNGARLDSNSEVIVECLKQPTVTDVKIKNGLVNIKVEKDMGVELIGNTTVKIAVEDDFDEYEEIFDSDEDKELDINVDDLDDNYIDVSTNNG